MQLLGIVGWKNSGKTTLVARLIPALRRRGLMASTIKHVHHDIDLDMPGKDTYAHRMAGAVDVVMFSRSRWAIMHEKQDVDDVRVELEDVLRRLSPVDLVLLEGFKNLPVPRIEIRAGDDTPPIRASDDIVAIVTDGPFDPKMPCFRRDEIEPLADFIADLVHRGLPGHGEFTSNRAQVG